MSPQGKIVSYGLNERVAYTISSVKMDNQHTRIVSDGQTIQPAEITQVDWYRAGVSKGVSPEYFIGRTQDSERVLILRAEVKGIFSTELDDLKHFVPMERDFGILFRVMVGPEGMNGEESFDITVCTPGWFRQKYEFSDVVVVRHHLIVFEYDYDRIVNKIKSIIERCEGSSWNEVAEKVARYGYWEFEDYTEG